jgi:hypothetical protein
MEALKIEPEVSVEERLSNLEGGFAVMKANQQQDREVLSALIASNSVMRDAIMVMKDSLETFKASIMAQQQANQKMWNNIKSFVGKYWLHIIFSLGAIFAAIYGLGYLMGANHMEPLVHLPGLIVKH